MDFYFTVAVSSIVAVVVAIRFNAYFCRLLIVARTGQRTRAQTWPWLCRANVHGEPTHNRTRYGTNTHTKLRSHPFTHTHTDTITRVASVCGLVIIFRGQRRRSLQHGISSQAIKWQPFRCVYKWEYVCVSVCVATFCEWVGKQEQQQGKNNNDNGNGNGQK